MAEKALNVSDAVTAIRDFEYIENIENDCDTSFVAPMHRLSMAFPSIYTFSHWTTRRQDERARLYSRDCATDLVLVMIFNDGYTSLLNFRYRVSSSLRCLYPSSFLAGCQEDQVDGRTS